MISRRLLRPSLRWLMLAGLLLGLAWQPVLAAASELHELTHEAVRSHGEANTDVPDEADGAGVLHALHQFAHCCGQAALAESAPLRLVGIGPDAPARATGAQRVPDGASHVPFRPPIQA